MKILLVCDQFHSANNGMTISARRFRDALIARGNEVRVLGYGEEGDGGDGAYLLGKQYIPVFDSLVTAQGMTFAKPDEDIISAAVDWADIAHFYTPFVLAHETLKLCRERGKPFTGAFHVQPENVTSSVHLGSLTVVNTELYRIFYNFVFKYCGHIHCPSRFIAGQLLEHGYTAKLHVISNGIDPDFVYRKLPKAPELEGKFCILMTGRLSIEKRQDVLIDAVRLSKHESEIQLLLAGHGPRLEFLRKRAEGFTNPINIKFYDKAGLIDLISMCDLYVHAADSEIEAMSCMEAFAGGLVPVIADSKKSATPQFALDERSLFPAGDAAALAEKIDYWIEHPAERAESEHIYAASAANYTLAASAEKLEQMFSEAIADGVPAVE